MNCNEFKRVLVEEARIPESGVLEAHALECPKCADLLQDERFLAGALGMLRRVSAADQASPEIEQRLLVEFRSWRRSGTARMFRFAFQNSRLWLAAAAAAVIAVGVMIWQLAPERTESLTPQKTAFPAVASPANAANQGIVAGDAVKAAAETQGAGDTGREPRPRQAFGKARTRVTSAGKPSVMAERSQFRKRVDSADEGEPRPAEVTEFFPTLRFAGNEIGTDLQLVRVQVSRRTLEEFGLTINPRLANRPVKADMLIGPDGLTRAVRFISERE
jgi:hypothetical protein